jgi:hypothetical protein
MEHLSKPSGITIPLFLKRKWRKQPQQQPDVDTTDVTSSNKNNDLPDDGSVKVDNNNGINDSNADESAWGPQLRLRHDYALTTGETNELSNRVFTSSELEERIWKTTTTMVDIQRQLYRGEEIYYEDTYNHGSIYKGWDAFVETPASVSGLGGGGNGGSSSQTSSSSSRRLPADSRWFSNSCKSVTRITPPATFPLSSMSPLLSSTVAARGVTTTTKTHLSTIPEKSFSSDSSTLRAASAPTILTTGTSISDPTIAIATATTTELINESIRSARNNTDVNSSTSTAAAATIANNNVTKSETPNKEVLDAKTKDDPVSSIRKKRKSAASSDEPPAKKTAGRTDSTIVDAASLMDTTKVGTTKSTIISDSGGTKSDTTNNSGTNTSTTTTKSEKKEAKSSNVDTSSKNEKEGGTTTTPTVPVPRKRGRPRRKT